MALASGPAEAVVEELFRSPEGRRDPYPHTGDCASSPRSTAATASGAGC